MVFKTPVQKIRFWLFCALVVLAPLSKYPSIETPLYSFSSFRIGLYQLLAVSFIGICLLPNYKSVYGLLKNHKWISIPLLLLIAIGLFNLLFVIDVKRSLLLVSSFMVLVLLLISAWWFVVNEINKEKLQFLLKILLVGGIVYSTLALLQLLFVSLTSQDLGLLCKNCGAAVFGFARVSLFTAEPQFLANSLIPFYFVALFSTVAQYKTKLALASLISTTLAIGITLSRGAYFAIIVTLIFATIVTAVNQRHLLKRFLGALLISASAFIVSLLILVGAATFIDKTNSNSAYTTLRGVLSQVSLGVIELPKEKISTQKNDSKKTNNPGLVEASTNERSTDAKLAINALTSNTKTLLLGVGFGNLGPYVVQNISPQAPYNLTVYIFYVLFLAEMGILGLVCLLLVLITVIVKLYKIYSSKPSTAPIGLLSIITAFVLQFIFFGSYINVMYVWLWVGIAAAFAVLPPKQITKLLS
jgi:hypothetical protein